MAKKFIGIIVILLLLGGGIAWYAHDNEEDKADVSNTNTSTNDESSAETTVSLTVNETDTNLASNQARESAKIELGNFYYQPNQLSFSPGSLVTLELENVEGNHDFVIDELDVRTSIFSAGTTQTVEFRIPDDAEGEYEFYCSVGNHRAQGMEGSIVIN